VGWMSVWGFFVGVCSGNWLLCALVVFVCCVCCMCCLGFSWVIEVRWVCVLCCALLRFVWFFCEFCILLDYLC